MDMSGLTQQLRIPDSWQQSALHFLQAGKDVIVAAPTGAGKTYIFELLVENGFSGKAVYTVPTRALANDKLLEWRKRGWEVGLATGDRTENPEAPVLVATLETQKGRLLRGEGPDLLVIDEYQMLGDQQRGLNYELAIASTPRQTQLLLLSGSVGNPKQVAQWLTRLGRSVEQVTTTRRPVPLEEIHIEALPDHIPPSVKGLWPRAIARVLKAGMAPLLTFAPRRKAAEDMAFDIARMLPEEDPLVLTAEQEKLAGDGLKTLLRARVAYHHSGLDYNQRAGLVEPLAKAGQLRVVVATMGLAAGINFSMRSVLVTDSEYRSGERTHVVRPDELLQMFGRAGRRGMDKVGYIAVAPGKPRLQEARALRLRRSNQIDWPSFLRVMQTAIESNQDYAESARQLAARLFSIQRIPLGLQQFYTKGPSQPVKSPRIVRQSITEFQNPDGLWERKRAPRLAPLADCLIYEKGHWKAALSSPATLKGLDCGTLCKLPRAEEAETCFGRSIPLARLGNDEKEGELVLTRWTLRKLRESISGRMPHRFRWSLARVESELIPRLSEWTSGGTFSTWRESGNILYALLEYTKANSLAQVDSQHRALLNPPLRIVEHVTDLDLQEVDTVTTARDEGSTAADLWYRMGLIDTDGAPTRRGILFSFFNYGEGLALAAALEDASYDLEELVQDLANIRAGYRFSELHEGSGRLGTACRTAFGMSSIPGYLHRGVPETYGDGAAEILFARKQEGTERPRRGGELRSGDIERARLEWRSLLRHIAAAPRLNWDRWLELQSLARAKVSTFPKASSLSSLPALTHAQARRHKSFLNFDQSA
jgi:hypothetical protein